MAEQLWPFIEELRENFRIADAFDIALISLLLYALLIWFRTTASRSLAIAISALAILYLAARVFDLYLTSLVFHAAFAAVLVVLVVVFQEDLRRLLERLATWGSLPARRQQVDVHPEVNTLVEAVFRLAETRTGALIVLKGREQLQRHVDGGIVLEGKLSKPLVYSLFDASSPGHDGAVILEQDRITMFGVHLPISKNQSEIRGRGTRHSAALGLTEQSDALVIVVSEERGVVSVAEGGKLRACETASALKGAVDTFYESHFPIDSANATRQLVFHNWPLKLIAVALGVLIWFTFAYQPGTIQRTFVAQVEYRNVPAGLVVDQYADEEARITLSGVERAFRFFDPASLKITVDLTDRTVGFLTIPVTEREVRVPPNLAIYRIDPRQLGVPLRAQEVERPGDTPRDD